MRIRFFLIFIFSALALAACQQKTTTPTPTEVPEGWIWSTETPRPWVTRAPDNIATPSPTPTVRPLSQPLHGRFAFQSDRDGGFEIYVMNADGTALSRLTNNRQWTSFHPGLRMVQKSPLLLTAKESRISLWSMLTELV